jgi:LacI family transcriptional regulator
MQLHLSGEDQNDEAMCLASLREQRADGILLVTGERGLVARDQVDAMVASGSYIVLLGWVEHAEHLDFVTGDDSAGGYELAKHLVELGHKRLAILGKSPHRGPYDRLLGFKKALGDAGLDLPDDVQVHAITDEEVAIGVRHLLSLSDPPTAIFAYQDSLAALVYKHLSDAGLSVPGDVSVVGFDDLELATYISPRLTTVGKHIEPLAKEFVKLLVQKISDAAADAEPQHVVVTPQLVVRESCAPPRNNLTVK